MAQDPRQKRKIAKMSDCKDGSLRICLVLQKTDTQRAVIQGATMETRSLEQRIINMLLQSAFGKVDRKRADFIESIFGKTTAVDFQRRTAKRMSVDKAISVFVCAGFRAHFAVKAKYGIVVKLYGEDRVNMDSTLTANDIDAYIRQLRCRMLLEVRMQAQSEGVSLRKMERRMLLPQGTLSRTDSPPMVGNLMSAFHYCGYERSYTLNRPLSEYPFSITE